MKYKIDKRRAEHLGRVWYLHLKRPKHKLLYWFFDFFHLGKVIKITDSQGKIISNH